MQVIGLKHVEKIEARADPAKFQTLKATLTTLKPSRNGVAHTYLKGVTMILDAPSVTRGRFVAVYEGLNEIERILRSLAL